MIDRKTHQTIDKHLCSLLALVKCVDVCQLLQEIHHGNADMWLMLSSYWQFTEVLCLFILNDHSKRGFNDISAGYTHLNAYNGLYWRHVVDYRLNLLLRISVLSWLRRPSRDWTAFSSTSRWYSSGIVATTCISWMMSFKSSSASMNLPQEDGKWGHHCEPPCEYESFAKIPDTHFSGLSGNLILSSWFLYDLFSKVKIIFFTVPSSTGSACQHRANHKIKCKICSSYTKSKPVLVRSHLRIFSILIHQVFQNPLPLSSSVLLTVKFSPGCKASGIPTRRLRFASGIFFAVLISGSLCTSVRLKENRSHDCKREARSKGSISTSYAESGSFFMFSSVCLF